MEEILNILVYSVTADSSGALSVLLDFYGQFKKKKENHYFFVVSTPKLDDCDNITVLRFPEIKKGWFHRLAFEYLTAPKLIKKYAIDEVFSTTNTTIPLTNIKQTLYLHQALPFIAYRFAWRENRLFWIYQNIIGKMIIASVRKADRVIVQTEWIRDAAVKICGVSQDKFIVQKPVVDHSLIRAYHERGGIRTFFYPASAYVYKNHWLILKACQKLKEIHTIGYRVIFTLTGKENPYAAELKSFVEKNALPIQFIGQISRQEVFEWYSRSTLLFPSYIETFGMPLLEARLLGAPVLAADTPFAKEILDGYERCRFYNQNDAEQLAEAMRNNLIR